MIVTFNDVALADGESRICKVASGLAPSGELGIETLEFLRATWAMPVARGNRVITLPMVIELPTCDDFEAAMVEGLLYFANLPDEGELTIQHGAALVTFSQAVCKSCKVREIEGRQNTVSLIFECGEPTHTTLSPLAQMNAKYMANLSAITGLEGGGSTNLDGLVTADVTLGFAGFITATIGGNVQTKMMRLVADPDPGATVTNTYPAAGTLIVLPEDYDETENAKIWIEQL